MKTTRLHLLCPTSVFRAILSARCVSRVSWFDYFFLDFPGLLGHLRTNMPPPNRPKKIIEIEKSRPEIEHPTPSRINLMLVWNVLELAPVLNRPNPVGHAGTYTYSYYIPDYLQDSVHNFCVLLRGRRHRPEQNMVWRRP